MTIQEAISRCGDKWIRPAGRKSMAYEVKRDWFYYRPSATPWKDFASLLPSEVCADWEIVDPEVMLTERGEIQPDDIWPEDVVDVKPVVLKEE